MSRRLQVALVVLGVLAVALTLNTITVSSATKRAHADPGGRILDLPGGSLQIREDGPRDGEPIVLVHGFASSLRWWDRVVGPLSEEHRVVRMDLLGHGGSEKPEHGYSMRDQARLVALALGELGVEAATVVGHSMGGGVATELVVQHSELVDRVVVIGTPPSSDFGNLPFRARLAFVPVLGHAIWRVLPDGVVRSGLESAFAGDVEVPDEFVEDFNRMTYTSYDSSHSEADDYTEERPLPVRMSDAAVPLLVIFGEEDELVDVEATEEWEEVPGSRIATLPKIGHTPHWEEPDETARLILEFAAEQGDEELGSESR